MGGAFVKLAWAGRARWRARAGVFLEGPAVRAGGGGDAGGSGLHVGLPVSTFGSGGAGLRAAGGESGGRVGHAGRTNGSGGSAGRGLMGVRSGRWGVGGRRWVDTASNIGRPVHATRVCKSAGQVKRAGGVVSVGLFGRVNLSRPGWARLASGSAMRSRRAARAGPSDGWLWGVLRFGRYSRAVAGGAEAGERPARMHTAGLVGGAAQACVLRPCASGA